MDKDALLKKLEDDGIKNFWAVYHDFNGRACTKTVPPPKFADIVEDGVVFARANLDFAHNDHMAEPALFTADTGDFLAVPDPNAYYPLPYLPGTALALVDMLTEAGAPFQGDSRGALKRMVAAYAEQGIYVTAALESEFALYTQTPDGDYAIANSDGMFTLAGLNRFADLMHEIVGTLEEMGIRVEQLGKEYGPSQYEMTTRYGDPVTAVDQNLVMKEVVRALALRHDVIASYMPKTFDEIPGCGMHVHMALWDADGNNIMAGDGDLLSPKGRSFIGGLLKHAPGLSGAGAPTVNSYKRLQPGSWAPAHITWGVGNRAGLVRVPDANKRVRAEFRVGDNTCNPYIFLTALLAAGLDGIENNIDPGEPLSDIDVGHMSEADMAEHEVQYLPRSAPEALTALEADSVLMDALSPVVGPEFLKVKRLEIDTYNLHVHAWERQMYLEVT